MRRHRRLLLVTLILAGAALFAGSARAACEDGDGDGYFRDSFFSCAPPVDCNDQNGSIHPGAVEVCNGFDDDCDGTLDEGCDRICDNAEALGNRVLLDPGAGSSDGPDIAWNGEGYGVLWEDSFSNPSARDSMFFIALSNMGTKMMEARKYYTPPSGGETAANLVWSGRYYGALWQRGPGPDEVLFGLIDEMGEPLDPPGFVALDQDGPGSPNQAGLSLAWNGFEFAAVWAQETLFGDVHIYLSRISGNGLPLTRPGGEAIVQAPGTRFDPVIAWNGTHYGVAWQDKRQSKDQIYFMLLDAAGEPIPPGERALTSVTQRYFRPKLAWADGFWAITYDDFQTGDMAMLRLDPSGEPLGPQTSLHQTPGSGVNQALSWTGEEFGLLWTESPYHLFGRADINGNPIPGSVVTLSNVPFAQNAALAWNGRDFGAVLDENVEIYFRGIGCNCADADGDGFSSCAGGDCNDAIPVINPNATEMCGDLVDNNCDGLTDCSDTAACPARGGQPPGEVTGVRFDPDETTLRWDAVTGATRYDVARGRLFVLRGRGDFALSVCSANDLQVTTHTDAAIPRTNDGFYYLVRAAKGTPDKCLNGTWGTALRDQTLTVCP